MFGNMSTSRTNAVSEEGIALHMRQVFNYMTGGVGLSGIIAWFMMTYNGGELVMNLINSGAFWVLIIAELGLVFFLSFRINKMEPSTALASFIGYAALSGATLAPLCFAYTQASVVQAFFVASGMFAAMSIWGYTTKKSLSGMGSFLFMGLIGLIIASVINIFMKSDGMSFIISLIAVPLFAGLTAYDTQKIKDIYAEVGHDEVSRSRAAVMGALALYLDFINLFIHLLRLIGERK